MDILVLARNAIAPQTRQDENGHNPSWLSVNHAQGLSLIGALLLLVGLLPAGPGGPAQPLQGGVLPVETILMLLIAAAIRAGAYPFHVWLLPANAVRLPLPDRFGDHLVPAICGLWLFGWASGLGGTQVLVQPELLVQVA